MLKERNLKLLSILANSNDYITSTTLACELGTSTKTIIRSINEINQELNKYDFKINSVKSKGYICDYSTKVFIKEFYLDNKTSYISTLPNNRIDDIVKLLLVEKFNSRFITIKNISDKLYFSESTIKNDLLKVKEILSNFNLSITNNNNGLIIKGDDNSLRLAIIHYFKDVNIFISENENLNIKTIETIILDTLQNNNVLLTDVGINNLLFYILLMLNNKDNSNIINNDEQLNNNYPNELNCAKSIVNELIKLTNNKNLVVETNNILKIIIAEKKVYKKLKNQKLNPKIVNAVKNIIKQIDQTFELNLQDDEIFIEGLTLHLDSALFRIKNNMIIKNELLSTIKNSYPFSYEIATVIANKLNDYFAVTFSSDECGYISLHVCSSLERNKNSNSYKKNRIALVCGSGIGTSLLINSKLQNIFSNKIEIIGNFTIYEINSLKNKCDLIISTVNIDKQIDIKIPIIVVSPLLSNKDITKINEFLLFNKIKSSTKLSDLFHDNLLFENLKFNNKADVIKFVSNQLNKQGFIDKECAESFLIRENMGTTEIGNKICIPHCLSGNIYKDCIAIATVENEIISEYGGIKIFVFLAININTINNKDQFILTIINKFTNTDTLVNLSNKLDIEYIKNLFFKEECL